MQSFWFMLNVAAAHVNAQVSKLPVPNVSGIGLVVVIKYHYCWAQYSGNERPSLRLCPERKGFLVWARALCLKEDFALRKGEKPWGTCSIWMSTWHGHSWEYRMQQMTEEPLNCSMTLEILLLHILMFYGFLFCKTHILSWEKQYS